MKVRVVPIEPHHDQIAAAYTLLSPVMSGEKAQRLCVEIYKAMIEHAPSERRGGLSKNQRKVHEVITEAIDRTNVSPTYREIARLVGFSDHSEAWRTVRTLSRKGIVRIGPGPREISLILRPEQT